jgi:hypothetical protein
MTHPVRILYNEEGRSRSETAPLVAVQGRADWNFFVLVFSGLMLAGILGTIFAVNWDQ